MRLFEPLGAVIDAAISLAVLVLIVAPVTFVALLVMRILRNKP